MKYISLFLSLFIASCCCFNCPKFKAGDCIQIIEYPEEPWQKPFFGAIRQVLQVGHKHYLLTDFLPDGVELAFSNQDQFQKVTCPEIFEKVKSQ